MSATGREQTLTSSVRFGWKADLTTTPKLHPEPVFAHVPLKHAPGAFVHSEPADQGAAADCLSTPATERQNVIGARAVNCAERLASRDACPSAVKVRSHARLCQRTRRFAAPDRSGMRWRGPE